MPSPSAPHGWEPGYVRAMSMGWGCRADSPAPTTVHTCHPPPPKPRIQPPLVKLTLDKFPQHKQPNPSEFHTRPVISPPLYSACRNLIKQKSNHSHKQCGLHHPFRITDQSTKDRRVININLNPPDLYPWISPHPFPASPCRCSGRLARTFGTRVTPICDSQPWEKFKAKPACQSPFSEVGS